jgi:hypothetical protein
VDNVNHTRATLFGLLGGLLATIVIDILTIALLLAMGLPWNFGFVLIGDTAAAFFALLGLDVAGGVPLGAALHYLIGVALGGLFGAAVSRLRPLRLSSTRKAIGLGILYTEVISLPILATPPILLKMATADIVRWFGLSFFMHAIFGLVLGLVVLYGLRPKTPGAHSEN